MAGRQKAIELPMAANGWLANKESGCFEKAAQSIALEPKICNWT
jgi:hypothetical protein